MHHVDPVDELEARLRGTLSLPWLVDIQSAKFERHMRIAPFKIALGPAQEKCARLRNELALDSSCTATRSTPLEQNFGAAARAGTDLQYAEPGTARHALGRRKCAHPVVD